MSDEMSREEAIDRLNELRQNKSEIEKDIEELDTEIEIHNDDYSRPNRSEEEWAGDVVDDYDYEMKNYLDHGNDLRTQSVYLKESLQDVIDEMDDIRSEHDISDIDE